MVRLTVDLIARSTSGYTKKCTDESMQHFLKRLSHLYLEDRSIDEIVSKVAKIWLPVLQIHISRYFSYASFSELHVHVVDF